MYLEKKKMYVSFLTVVGGRVPVRVCLRNNVGGRAWRLPSPSAHIMSAQRMYVHGTFHRAGRARLTSHSWHDHGSSAATAQQTRRAAKKNKREHRAEHYGER